MIVKVVAPDALVTGVAVLDRLMGPQAARAAVIGRQRLLARSVYAMTVIWRLNWLGGRARGAFDVRDLGWGDAAAGVALRGLRLVAFLA